MRKLLWAALALALSAGVTPALADTVVLSSCGTEALTAGTVVFTQSQDTTGRACVSCGAVSNPSIGTNNTANPGSSTQIGIKDGVGNLQPVSAANPAPTTDTTTQSILNAIATAGASPITVADGANVTLGAKADAKSTATDTTSITIMQVLKEISAMVQAPPTQTVNPSPSTTTGCTPYGLQSAASTNSTNVKASAGTICAMNLINTTTTIYYLRTYDSASAPTCSSATNFIRTWPIPPSAQAGGAGGIAANLGAFGTKFSNGISFCLTGGGSSTDNTNAATGVVVNLDTN